MRRSLALVVSALLASAALTVGVLAASSPSSAAGLLTGRLVDSTGGHPSVVGATVKLRTVTETGPGTVVDTDTTNSAGEFALNAGPSPDDEYYVQVVAGTYQGGYVGGAPGAAINWVEAIAENGATYSPDAAIGKIYDNPAFIQGRLIDATTKKPVKNVKVTARSANDIAQVEGSDVTNARGVFRITGLECEDDCYLKFAGAPQGYEIGFRSCPGGVVADWGDACASPIGLIGKVRIEHL